MICSDECNQQNGDSNSSAEGQIDNDFQKIFLKAVFGDNFLKISKNTPEKTARIPDDNTLRDSQIIDIEEVVPTFLLNSQKKRVDAVSKTKEVNGKKKQKQDKSRLPN